MMNMLNKLMPFFILLLPIYLTIAVPPANAAAPVLYAAGELYLPEKPTPPQRPISPRNNEKKQAAEQQPAAQQPAPTTPPQQSTFNKPPAKEETTKAKQPTADQQPDNSSKQTVTTSPTPAANTPPIANDNDETSQSTEPATKSMPMKNGANTFFSTFVNYTLYSTLLLAIIVLSGYLYFTTPKDSLKQTRAPSPKKSAPQIQPRSTAASKLPTTEQHDPLLSNIKITNRSLLEQLIKYDLETYGEIRTNLDYEQPAYVEKLIRKYGGSDQNKINRAIHLFYQNRKQK